MLAPCSAATFRDRAIDRLGRLGLVLPVAVHARPEIEAGGRRLRREAVEEAEANLRQQAATGNYDNNPSDVTEMDALVAYLQVLGTMVDFKQFDDDYFVKFR